jgi:autotransporter-associated beta strand protein
VNGNVGAGTIEAMSGSADVILAGSGIALNKTTSGTVTLSQANTYTGNTTISAGTLALGVGGS